MVDLEQDPICLSGVQSFSGNNDFLRETGMLEGQMVSLLLVLHSEVLSC